jgi:hypothetical protein
MQAILGNKGAHDEDVHQHNSSPDVLVLGLYCLQYGSQVVHMLCDMYMSISAPRQAATVVTEAEEHPGFTVLLS